MWLLFWIDSLYCLCGEGGLAIWLSLFPLQLWLVMLLLLLRLSVRYLRLDGRSRRLEPWLTTELSEREHYFIAFIFLCFLARLGWWIASHPGSEVVNDVSFVAFVLGCVSFGGLSYVLADLKKLLAIAKAKDSAVASLLK